LDAPASTQGAGISDWDPAPKPVRYYDSERD